MLRRFTFLLACRPSEAYHRLVTKGEVAMDEHQVRALPMFDRLYDDLVKYTESAKTNPPPKRQVELRPPNRLGIIPSFFLRREQEEKVNAAVSGGGKDSPAQYHPLSKVKGLYVYGGVGCGKTMLMNLLYDNAPLQKKKMIHFHQFMLDVQKTSHDIKNKEESTKRQNMVNYNTDSNARRTPEASIDLYDEIAQRMLSNVELLCFDEVAVADIAHAMILKRLFHAFYKLGLVVIFTSNRPPEQLYLDGLNRGGFLPFIDLVNQQCTVHHMVSTTDHRMLGHAADTYLAPFSTENAAKFQGLFLEYCKAMPPKEKRLEVFGRSVVVPRACGGVCYFHFSEVCGSEMSTADFTAVAKTFHTVFIDGVPRFSYESSDVKQRFLLLVDTLYEYRCRLFVYAEVPPAQLQESREEAPAISSSNSPRHDELSEFEQLVGNKLIDAGDSHFQMERCISRLNEMSSKEYLDVPHRHEELNISSEV